MADVRLATPEEQAEIRNYVDALAEVARLRRELDAENADYWRERCEEAERCRECLGTGVQTGYLRQKCYHCKGKGKDRGPTEEKTSGDEG